MRHSQIEISKVINWPVGIDYPVRMGVWDCLGSTPDIYLSDIAIGAIHAAD